MGRSNSINRIEAQDAQRALDAVIPRPATRRRDPIVPLREHCSQIKMHLTVLEQQGIRKISPRAEVIFGELRAVFEQLHEIVRSAGRPEPKQETADVGQN